MLTADTDRLAGFYEEMFGASVEGTVSEEHGVCLTIIKVGATARLNVFEVAGNDQAKRQAPMFARGRLDHFGLLAASLDSFDTMRDRLVACGASDGFVTDFGDILSLWFRDPDGLEVEVCVANPNAQPGVYHPPGTPSRLHHPVATRREAAIGADGGPHSVGRPHPWGNAIDERASDRGARHRAEQLPLSQSRASSASAFSAWSWSPDLPSQPTPPRTWSAGAPTRS